MCLLLWVFSTLLNSGKISGFTDLKRVSWQGGRLGSWRTGCILKYSWQKKNTMAIHSTIGWGSTQTCPASPSRDLAALNGRWKEICMQGGHILLIVKCEIGQCRICVYIVTLLSLHLDKADVSSHSQCIERKKYTFLWSCPATKLFHDAFSFYWKGLTQFIFYFNDNLCIKHSINAVDNPLSKMYHCFYTF